MSSRRGHKKRLGMRVPFESVAEQREIHAENAGHHNSIVHSNEIECTNQKSHRGEILSVRIRSRVNRFSDSRCAAVPKQ